MSCEPEQLYLTHYSRVQNLPRLAKAMHAGIDAYEKMALDCSDADDRQAALEAAMYDYLSEGLIDHGFTGGEEAMRAILAIDVELNAAGLVAWLARQDRSGTRG